MGYTALFSGGTLVDKIGQCTLTNLGQSRGVRSSCMPSAVGSVPATIPCLIVTMNF